MSQTTSILAEPSGDQRIPEYTLGYVSEAARDDLFDMVLRNCVESGISRATLARRLGKDPAQITRLLGAPGNWTIDTVAELLFAIDGRVLKVDSCWPEREPISNLRHSQWLETRTSTWEATTISAVIYSSELEVIHEAPRMANAFVTFSKQVTIEYAHEGT